MTDHVGTIKNNTILDMEEEEEKSYVNLSVFREIRPSYHWNENGWPFYWVKTGSLLKVEWNGYKLVTVFKWLFLYY